METQKKEGKWYMAGTEGTGEYLVLAETEYGRVGIRPLSGGWYRIRVEPSEKGLSSIKCLSRESGWKQPGQDGQIRYSIMTPSDSFLERRLQALLAIGATRDDLDLRTRRLEKMNKAELVELAKKFFPRSNSEETKIEIARLLIPEGLLLA